MQCSRRWWVAVFVGAWMADASLPCVGDAAVPEPMVTAVNKPTGVTEITVVPADGSAKVTYKVELSRHFSPARQKTPLLARWESWKFGAFVCFGSNQFSGSEHCRADDPAVYRPTNLDVAGWIAAFKQAGMKYAVLTARHTSKVLLWPSATTNCDVAASPCPTDVVGDFVRQCREQGLAPGLYYCIWGGKAFNPHPHARAIVLAQLHELTTRYGSIPMFWIDMMNWAPADLDAQQVYDAIKSRQPEAIVLMNQHVQDGSTLRYFPTDAVNGELVPPPSPGHNPRREVNGVNYYLPFEYEPCSQTREKGIPYDPLGPSCWFTYGEGKAFPPSRSFSAEAIARRIRFAQERGASNVLLATAPDHSGRMRPADVAELVRLGKLLAEPCTSERLAKGPAPAELRKQLRRCLEQWCDWVLTLGPGRGTLQNTADTSWSIFINGNFARLLMAAHGITGREDYLREALAWCDNFVERQEPVTTSKGQPGGFWHDGSQQRNLYLADAGTAATALALGYSWADSSRQKRYLQAMERFSRFVRDGCQNDPQGRGRGGSPGWVVASGKARGALGCGYYGGHLSTAEYIISSATNAGAFHALLYSINKAPELATVSAGAIRWILSTRLADGQFPYLLDGMPPKLTLPLCTLTYVGDGLIGAHTHLADAGLRQQIAVQIKPAVQWLLANQNADGTWGKEHGFDQQRSPGVVTLLAWYYREVDPDPRIARAVTAYARFLLDPANQEAYGIRRLVRTTGFAGLAIAELIEPGVTFRRLDTPPGTGNYLRTESPAK